MDESPIRQQIDEIRTSPAYQDNLPPSHPQALDTISKLYAMAYPEPGETVAPEEVEGTTKEVEALKESTLKVDDPEAAKIQEDLQPLREEWKVDYDKNVEVAQSMTANLVKEYGVDAAEVMDVIGNHALVIKNMFEWSKGRPGSELTPAEAKEVIQLLQKTEAYQRGSSRTSDTIQQIVAALYTIAYR
jgi:cytoskeletal protein RodZ